MVQAKQVALSAAKKEVSEKGEEEATCDRTVQAAKQELNMLQREASQCQQREEVKHKRADDSRLRCTKKAEWETTCELAFDDMKLLVWRTVCWIKGREAEEEAARAWQKAGYTREKAEKEHINASSWEDKARQATLLAEFQGHR